MYKAQKRKHKPNTPRNHERRVEEVAESTNASLYIQAYEADVVRGSQALAAADSLEVERDLSGKVIRVGSGLIKWGPNSSTTGNDDGDGQGEIWVDRYALVLRGDCLVSASWNGIPFGVATSEFMELI